MVLLPVADRAKRDAVFDIITKFRMIRIRFDVVSVQRYALPAALAESTLLNATADTLKARLFMHHLFPEAILKAAFTIVGRLGDATFPVVVLFTLDTTGLRLRHRNAVP